MSKYIIKNCPARLVYKDEQLCLNVKNLNDAEQFCIDYETCLLKQIVKKCRKSLEVSYCQIEQEILELLDIQEVE